MNSPYMFIKSEEINLNDFRYYKYQDFLNNLVE